MAFTLNCRDGRIKIFGGDNIEGLLISPKSVPYKYLQV
jgi:syntaxin-binding protein 5